jgi:hypothetical protein
VILSWSGDHHPSSILAWAMGRLMKCLHRLQKYRRQVALFSSLGERGVVVSAPHNQIIAAAGVFCPAIVRRDAAQDAWRRVNVRGGNHRSKIIYPPPS